MYISIMLYHDPTRIFPEPDICHKWVSELSILCAGPTCRVERTRGLHGGRVRPCIKEGSGCRESGGQGGHLPHNININIKRYDRLRVYHQRAHLYVL
jgi:hypothetical protein